MPTVDLAGDYRLGPEILIHFVHDLPGHAWWCPDSQVMLVDATLRGRELAVTLLHEIGHMLCADHGALVDGTDAEAVLDLWAEQCAELLEQMRPGRRAVPA